jgi:hypothetical protein
MYSDIIIGIIGGHEYMFGLSVIALVIGGALRRSGDGCTEKRRRIGRSLVWAGAAGLGLSVLLTIFLFR